jgi:hypothetical protein
LFTIQRNTKIATLKNYKLIAGTKTKICNTEHAKRCRNSKLLTLVVKKKECIVVESVTFRHINSE